MNYLILILVFACPFWISDLAFRALHIAPPLWVGDAMAMALLILVLFLLLKSVSGLLKERFRIATFARIRARSIHQLEAAPAKNLWEYSLPSLFHEIRNYSSTLRANALLLRRQLPDGNILEPLERLERTTEKIDGLAKEFLDAASTTVNTVKALDMRGLIQNCIQDHFTESRSFFRISQYGNSAIVDGDSLKLERVFLNLFRNSLEAGASRIHVGISSLNGRVRIQVEDDGSGCTGEQVSKLFLPMFTTKKERGGTGLGLFLVKSIIESHQGSIRTVSKNTSRGKSGMIFCIELPKSKRARANAFMADFQSHGNPGSSGETTERKNRGGR